MEWCRVGSVKRCEGVRGMGSGVTKILFLHCFPHCSGKIDVF